MNCEYIPEHDYSYIQETVHRLSLHFTMAVVIRFPYEPAKCQTVEK